MTQKVLVVDDDLEGLKLVGLMLRRRGYEVVSAYDGAQALAKAKTDSPDLVILDVMMPDMDGYEVCQRLRLDPETAYLPVLMFTAKTLVGDKVAGFQAGADDYLTKPIHPSELVSRVEALLKRSRQKLSEVKSLTRARVVGVLGAKGGVGTSTLVVNLALAAAQDESTGQSKDNEGRICVADVRAGLGTVALQLGEVPRGGWPTLAAQSVDDLGEGAVENQMVAFRHGVRYLPAPLQPGDGQASLPPDHVDIVLHRMTTMSDFLILDLGSVLDEASVRAVSICDALVVVIEPERLCLTLVQTLLERIKALDVTLDDVYIVLIERLRTDAVFSRVEVEEILGKKITGVIGPAGRMAQEATERGEPIVLLHPESETARQYRRLSDLLLA